MPSSRSASPSTVAGPSTAPANRHAPTPLEKQRAQLEKLLKDPTKPVHIPTTPKDKTIRPAREMMKNVQGSSAGAGSGEFHVYKASRRREYERLKIMDEKMQKDAAEREFETKKRQWEEEANAKTSKNRAKRLKRKERSKVKPSREGEGDKATASAAERQDAPLKKRRMVNGAELVFQKPHDDDDEESSADEEPRPTPLETSESQGPPTSTPDISQVPIIDTPKIVIHDD